MYGNPYNIKAKIGIILANNGNYKDISRKKDEL